MTWTSGLGSKVEGDPTRAVDWNALVANLAALAAGDSGAPLIELALGVTSASSDTITLDPDVTGGKYLVFGAGANGGTPSAPAYDRMGVCLVDRSAGSITAQMTMLADNTDSYSVVRYKDNNFTYSGGDVTMANGDVMIAVPLGTPNA